MMIVYFFVLFLFQADRIRFAKCGGDLGLSAGFPRSRIHLYSASRGAPTSNPS